MNNSIIKQQIKILLQGAKLEGEMIISCTEPFPGGEEQMAEHCVSHFVNELEPHISKKIEIIEHPTINGKKYITDVWLLSGSERKALNDLLNRIS